MSKRRQSARLRQQTELAFPNGWGGYRKGAGRKPKGERAGVSHSRRSALAARFPAHVTMRVQPGLPSLRGRGEQVALRAAFAKGCEQPGFRLVHYSVQANHLHLLVEGANRTALTRGLRGLAVRMARALNCLWGRAGSVFADRCHEHVLRTPREVWHALRYVLCNARKHGGWTARTQPDPCSSGRWFDGWRDREPDPAEDAPVAQARTWLLRKGWRRHGLLSLEAAPSGC